MDFGALPPEVNSARMYTGPGSGPMLAAASAFAQSAHTMRSAFAEYQSTINSLVSETWMGPASAAMAAAAAPYTAWLNNTAGLLEQSAMHATEAAAAFDLAHAMVVPPPVVTANRSRYASLMATNVLGQNAAAIAAAQAEYFEMWAQDALAMYSYAANSAAATQVTPFAAPKFTTDPAAQANQQAATAQAAGSTAATNTQSVLSQTASTIPSSLQATTPASLLDELAASVGLQPGDISNAVTNFSSSTMSPMSVAAISQVGADAAVIHSVANGGIVGPYGGVIPGWGEGIPGGMVPDLLAPGSGVSMVSPPSSMGIVGVSQVSGALGRGSLVGSLSVPQGWSGATATPAPAASLVSSWTAAPAAEPAGAPGMPGMPLAGAGAGRGYGFAVPRYGFKPTVMVRPVIAG